VFDSSIPSYYDIDVIMVRFSDEIMQIEVKNHAQDLAQENLPERENASWKYQKTDQDIIEKQIEKRRKNKWMPGLGVCTAVTTHTSGWFGGTSCFTSSGDNAFTGNACWRDSMMASKISSRLEISGVTLGLEDFLPPAFLDLGASSGVVFSGAATNDTKKKSEARKIFWKRWMRIKIEIICVVRYNFRYLDGD
jgi:hypothetical protein